MNTITDVLIAVLPGILSGVGTAMLTLGALRAELSDLKARFIAAEARDQETRDRLCRIEGRLMK